MRLFAPTALLLLISLLDVSAAPLVIARVNGEAITPDSFKEEFKRLHGGHMKFLAGAPEVTAFLEKVIDRRLLIQEAYRIGLDELPAIQDATRARAEERALTYLLTKEIDSKATATEEEVRQAWARNTREMFEVRQVVLATREEADEVRRLLMEGADMEALARACSIARTRTQGGTLPTVRWGDHDPEWEDVVFRLLPGETSQPFASPDGWEVVRVLSRRFVAPPELVKAYNAIEGVLKRRKLDAARRTFSEALWKRYHARHAIADRSPAALHALLATAPDSELVTWDGGALTLRAFAEGLDLSMFAQMPERQAQGHLDDLLRKTVNDALVRLEVTRRRIGEVPEVESDVRAYREGLMEGALYEDYVLKGIEVSEEEVKAYYEEHKSEITSPERRRTSHVVVPTEELATELRLKILAGERFEDIVNANSTDVQTKKKGGDLGWVTAREIPPNLAPVLELQAGQVTEPLKSEFGWHLFKVTAIDPPHALAFEAAREELGQKLLDEKRTRQRAEWVSKLRQAATITIDAKAIEALAQSAAPK